MKKGLMMFAATLAMLVCLCFGVAACAPTEQENGKENFPAPTGVKVEKDVLSWAAVEGATGYTVKINSDETTKVSVASLDLTTVTAKLTAGDNTLSVKTNATAEKGESAYSSTVTYTYQVDAGSEASSYKALVDAIGSITKDSAKAEADAVKTAIEAAEAKYAALSNEAKSLQTVTDAKAAFDAKKKAYDDAMAAAETLHTAFKNAVNAATATIEKKESLATLKADQTAAETANSALTALAKGLVTEAEQTAYEAIAKAVSEWEKAIADEKTKLGAELPALSDDASAEEIVAKADTALEGYSELPAYVTSDSDVSALKADVEQKKSAAVAKLQQTVDALKSEAKSALGQSDLKAKYAALLAVQEKEKALGACASGLYGEEQKAEIAEAVKTIEQQVAETQRYETYLSNNHSEQNIYVVVRKLVNVLGKPIKLDTLPTVSVTMSGNVSATATVAYSEDGSYVATIPFTKAAENGSVELTYKWENIDDESTTVKLGAPQTNFWFFGGDTTENRAYKTDGTITKNEGPKVDKDLYFDLYPDGALEFKDETGANNYGDKDITVKGAPILTEVPAKEVGTLTLLKKQLAEEGIFGKMTVVILAYQVWEESGVTYYSAVSSASLSDPIKLDVTEDDAFTRLDTSYLSSSIQSGNNKFELYNPAYIANINGQINAYSEQTHVTLSDETDMRKYLQARIRAITVSGEDVTVLHEEAVEMVFIGYGMEDFVSAWTLSYFKAHFDEYKADATKADPAFENVKYQVCYEPKAEVDEKPSPLCDIFRASEWIDVKQGDAETFNVTLKKADVTAPSEAQLNFTTNGFFEFLRKEGHNGYVFRDYNAAYVELNFTKGDASYTAYFFMRYDAEHDGDDNAKYRLDLYKDQAKTGDPLGCDAVTNGYTTIDDFNTWAKAAYSLDETFDAKDGWSFKTRVIVNENSGWLFDGGWSAAVTYNA